MSLHGCTAVQNQRKWVLLTFAYTTATTSQPLVSLLFTELQKLLYQNRLLHSFVVVVIITVAYTETQHQLLLLLVIPAKKSEAPTSLLWNLLSLTSLSLTKLLGYYFIFFITFQILPCFPLLGFNCCCCRSWVMRESGSMSIL